MMNNLNLLNVICNKHGEVFEIEAQSHLDGKGCPECDKSNIRFSKTSFIEVCKTKDHDPILYVIFCYNDTEQFYKIGITSNSVKYRFSSKVAMPYDYKIIREVIHLPEHIYTLEKYLHREYKNSRFTPSISFAGQTECFNNIEEIEEKINLYFDTLLALQEEEDETAN